MLLTPKIIYQTTMTQKELVLEYIKEYGQIIPAKQHGVSYKGGFLGSELSRRCRELRAEGKLLSRGEGKFEVYFLPYPVEKTSYEPKRMSQPYIYRAPERCCEVVQYCYEKNLPITHSKGCKTQKQIYY